MGLATGLIAGHVRVAVAVPLRVRVARDQVSVWPLVRVDRVRRVTVQHVALRVTASARIRPRVAAVDVVRGVSVEAADGTRCGQIHGGRVSWHLRPPSVE
jgi:hypothetical protein